MKNLRYISAMVASLFLIPAVVNSADEKQTMRFELLDSNGDGFISRSEATSNNMLRERWNNIDTDMDGKLTQQEFSRFANAPKEAFPEN